MLEVSKSEYDLLTTIKEIVSRRGIAEVHEEKGNYVVVELKRKLNSKHDLSE